MNNAPPPATSTWSRVARHGLDLVLVAVLSVGAAVIAESVLVPMVGLSPLVAMPLVPCAILLIIWAILRWRGESWVDLGLRRPENLGATALLAAGLVAFLLLFVTVTEAIGLQRDFSQWEFVRASPLLLLYGIVYVVLFAGFFEEILFRGFLMRRLAQMFGEGRRSWFAAILVQALLFGLAHFHQGWIAIPVTAFGAAVLGAAFFFGGRNLWPLMVAHGVYDAVRIVGFYFGYVG